MVVRSYLFDTREDDLMSDEALASQKLLEFSSRKRVPLILQAEVAECGLATMAMVASFHGYELDLPALRKRFSANLKGMNLQQLIELGDSLGLMGRALKCPIESVKDLSLPCILHWDMNHFVVLTKVDRKYISINDPAKGKLKLKHEEFSRRYTGIALELVPGNEFKPKSEKQRMQIYQLWSKMTGLKLALFKLLILSLVLQLFALMSPYYMQWVVDEVLVSRDQSLLVVLAIGFAILKVIGVVTGAVRSWLIIRLSSVLNLQMGVNLLHHLLRLPMSFFESRHVGDIVSRFGSLGQIRERITTGLVETLVDGIMSITVLCVMFLYSFKLTVVVLIAVALYGLLRFILFQPLHVATEEAIQTDAKEQSNFLESIRGIQAIKLFGNESQRQGIWQNRFAEVINAEIRLGKLRIGFDTIHQLLIGFESIVVVYLGAQLVITNQISIGMLLAFIAYKNQFGGSAIGLIEQIIEFKMMRLHLDRISDIALHEQEAYQDCLIPPSDIDSELRLENLCFSYGKDEPEIIDNLSITFEKGDFIAITGESGCGKTTLAKLILGLMKPTSGRILLGGKDISHIGLKSYRKQIAAVMQEDTLLAGSVLDNISFFDPEPNYLKVEKCAHLAAIHDDIEKMTMGYSALVGDMGSNLSGGQIQRLLLARALYKQPQILFMDEATSNLDIDNESKINNQIVDLEMTRIVIAHRPETIKRANKIYRLRYGRLELAGVGNVLADNGVG